MTDPTSAPTDKANKTGGSLGTLIRILITEDQAPLYTILAVPLEAEPGVSVVGLAEDGARAATLIAELRPDVALVDIQIPDLTGIEATRGICVNPTLAATRVLTLIMSEINDYVLGALRTGVYGFLLKDADPQSLVDAVRTVHEGQPLLGPQVLTRLVARMPSATSAGTFRSAWAGEAEALTPRQREILLLIAQDLSNSEIEVGLGITRVTCRSHTIALLARLGARNHVQLVIAAHGAGLINPHQGPLRRFDTGSYLRA